MLAFRDWKNVFRVTCKEDVKYLHLLSICNLCYTTQRELKGVNTNSLNSANGKHWLDRNQHEAHPKFKLKKKFHSKTAVFW